ncbi:MAG: putative signal transduction histidine kinase [Paucimonas sp.]|nr:putative signal transduction histidine kinase [Paucimonas sp.]
MQSRNTDPDPASPAFFYIFTMLVCVVLVFTGACAIFAWHTGLRGLVEAMPGVPAIKANTGAAMIAGGLALGLCNALGAQRIDAPARRRWARAAVSALALAMLLLSAITLVEYGSGLDAGIDRWQEFASPGAGANPGRMSFLAAICVLLAGAALALIDHRLKNGHYLAEYFAILMLGFMAVPLIGYLFSVTAMVDVASSQGVGPHTALLFMLFGLGLLTARPTHRVMALWNSEGPGAALVRRLLPKSLLLLLLLFLLVDRGARLGFYGYEKVSPLVVLLAGAWLSVLFWRAGALLNREHEERRSRELALSRTSQLLRAVSDNTPDAIYIKDRAGAIVFANPATARMMGLDGRDLTGMTTEQMFAHPRYAAEVIAHDNDVMSANAARAMEESVHLPDGAVRTLYSTKTPWTSANGEVCGVIGISTDITERKRVEDALREHEMRLEKLVQERTAEVSELIGHIESTREEEKRAIARELHDDLGSALTALSMHLAILFQKMPHDPVLAERAQQIKALLGAVTQTTRRIQVGLRPDKLDIFGIKTAIAEQCLEFENYTGVTCKADLPDEDLAYAPATEIGLYRMLQEGLNNVAKHAKAARVDVVLDDSEDGIVLSIRDNGVGFATSEASRRLTHGLRGMRERAQYLGGDVRINSAPGKGTSITIRLPRTEADKAFGAGEQREVG